MVTCLPWYAILFVWDDDKRPAWMQGVARLYLDALMTLPVAVLTFMVTPGFVAGSLLTMSLFPYAIVPYVVLFVTPVIGTISVWSLYTVVAHGLGNWWIL